MRQTGHSPPQQARAAASLRLAILSNGVTPPKPMSCARVRRAAITSQRPLRSLA
jgi:hypothetical protein